MDSHRTQIAETCLRGAESNAMTFPRIVGALMAAGFESYFVDFRQAKATYYTPDGDSVELISGARGASIAPDFDAAAVRSAISEAQNLVPGYTYKGFCAKVMASGCAGYLVSFSGRRAVYFGRTGETHVEHFPR